MNALKSPAELLRLADHHREMQAVMLAKADAYTGEHAEKGATWCRAEAEKHCALAADYALQAVRAE